MMRNMDVAKSWEYLELILGGGDTDISKVSWRPVSPSDELREAVLFLSQSGMPLLIEDWLCEIIYESLSDVVYQKFWSFFDAAELGAQGNRELSATVFCNAMDYLYDIYEGQYMEAVRRLRGLYKLAASAPSISPAGANCDGSSFSATVEIPSAFTPVKTGSRIGGAGHPLRAGKSVWFEQSASTHVESSSGDDRPVRLDDISLLDDSAGEIKEHKSKDEHSMNVDESYVPENGKPKSNEGLGGSSFQGVTKSNNLLQPSHFGEKNNGGGDSIVDDDESFIRSPICVSKKQTVYPAHSGSATPSSQSASSLRAMSNTSTPGMVLTNVNTPGHLTPIVSDESSPLFGKHMESSDVETPLFRNVSPKDKSELPDASIVFGCPVSARPLPGKVVTWPSSQKALISKIQVTIKSILFYTFTIKFSAAIKHLYSWAFDVYKCEHDLDSVTTSELSLDRFARMNLRMEEMGLMELISGSAVTELVHTQIEKHIDECKGNFDTSFIKDHETWLDDQVLGWLKNIYASKDTPSQQASISSFSDRLRPFIYEKYGRSLIGQFFDIIIDFPDSKPAIEDLKSCMEKTDLRSELVTSVKKSLESRLLHPGVNTAVILTAYIAAIKSLRLLEPAGVILELVCEPVGRYLRSREDTVRCIVASLTDDSNNELVSELVNTKPVPEETDEEDSGLHPLKNDWEPDPVDADPSSGSKFRRSADILSTLVNIYGSKELFVNEYRALLADRILTQYNYDVERELRYLELLKLRFGEAQLHFCEVMLRDVSESKRVNTRIQEAGKREREQEGMTEEDLDMNAMILSAQYWPAFRDEKIKLPSELQEQLDKYTRSFEQQKQNRTLVWKPHLGVMNIDLELGGETLSFSVSPVQAAIIMKFQERKKWSLDDLSEELEMTPSVLRRKLAFWQSQGLLRESADCGTSSNNQQQVYTLIEDLRGARGGQDVMAMTDIEEEVESAMASAQQQKEEEMQILWTYIQGMLANLDCLPLERIHAMLRMFASDEPGSELSVQQLKTFLDGKVKDQVLIFSAGVYRLNK